MGKPGPDWNATEDSILVRSPNLSAQELTALLPGRTRKAIQQRRIRLGNGNVRYQRNWTPEEDQIIEVMLEQNKTAREIGHALNRLTNAVKHRIKRLRATDGDMEYVIPAPGVDPWAGLAPDAFKDIRVSADPRTSLAKPLNRTAGGVGSRMLVV